MNHKNLFTSLFLMVQQKEILIKKQKLNFERNIKQTRTALQHLINFSLIIFLCYSP